MPQLLVLALVGVVAQLTAGSLGMGYGVISTSALLAVGLAPAIASATVHFAEVGTSLALGTAHWRMRNVDRRLMLRLGVPGALGAFGGALLLAHATTSPAISIAMAVMLLALGLYILVRFSWRPPAVAQARVSPHTVRLLVPMGLLAGFIDATVGGGWGPVNTTVLLSAGRTAPRTVIGSVDASKFLVSVSACVAFVIGLGFAGINLGYVGALFLGGLVVSPVAAWLVRRVPASVLGTAVGGIVITTNLRTILLGAHVSGAALVLAFVAAGALWLAAVAVSVARHRHGRRSGQAIAAAS